MEHDIRRDRKTREKMTFPVSPSYVDFDLSERNFEYQM